ncbi:MAG: type II toxin-antitoxin system VapC family toxin [Methanoregulaceae archaeon]
MPVSLEEGTTVFIDANIFLSIIFENSGRAESSVRFLESVHEGTIHGTTSVLVLNEVLHRLLIASVVNDAGIPLEEAVTFLKIHPTHICETETSRTLIEDIRNIRNLKILGISEKTFVRSLAIMKEYGLLSNDALHVACMEEHALSTIATFDRDFERVSRIRVWRPDA